MIIVTFNLNYGKYFTEWRIYVLHVLSDADKSSC